MSGQIEVGKLAASCVLMFLVTVNVSRGGSHLEFVEEHERNIVQMVAQLDMTCASQM